MPTDPPDLVMRQRPVRSELPCPALAPRTEPVGARTPAMRSRASAALGQALGHDVGRRDAQHPPRVPDDALQVLYPERLQQDR